ncbi:MAG: hypothetical protein R6U61_08705 [Thermoplasmata archaeon]
MEKDFCLKKYYKITILVWSIFIILFTVSTYYFIKYRPVVEPYLEWWYPLILTPILYGIETYFYRKNKIKVRNNYLEFPRPYTRTKISKLKYNSIEKIVVKSDDDIPYLFSIIDQRENEYKISNFVGKKTSTEMFEILDKIIKRRSLDINTLKI